MMKKLSGQRLYEGFIRNIKHGGDTFGHFQTYNPFALLHLRDVVLTNP